MGGKAERSSYSDKQFRKPKINPTMTRAVKMIVEVQRFVTGDMVISLGRIAVSSFIVSYIAAFIPNEPLIRQSQKEVHTL